VPFPAGGAQDIVGRVIADRLGALWKVPTIVENVPGAGGNIGIDRVAKGPTDGTQILIVPPGLATNQFLYNRLAYDPEKGFVLLGLVATVANLLCVRKDLPVNSVAELIAHAKANPGKLNYASSGIGTTVHLSAELFKRTAGVEMVHVAYRAGAVKPLGITTLKQSTLAPEYETVAATVPGFDTASFTGVAVKAGTPKAICDRIEADTRLICEDPLLKERLAGLIAETVSLGSPQFTAFVAAERAKWGKLIGDLKLRVE